MYPKEKAKTVMNTFWKPGFCVSGFLVLLCAATLLEAGVVPGRWEKVEALPIDHPIIVKAVDGEKIHAGFGGCGPDELILITGPEERKLPKSHVLEVTSQEKTENDSLIKGALIGAAIPVAILVPVAATFTEKDDQGKAAVAIAIWAAAGAGVGILVDSQIKAREVYYKAAK